MHINNIANSIVVLEKNILKTPPPPYSYIGLWYALFGGNGRGCHGLNNLKFKLQTLTSFWSSPQVTDGTMKLTFYTLLECFVATHIEIIRTLN